MKTYQATVRSGQVEQAMDLPGWQYRRGAEFRAGCSYYPFVDTFAHIVFSADNRSAASKQMDRCGLLGRDLAEV
jgi:hypothetical protein